MLVKDCMTRHPILISANSPAAEAQKVMSENHVRHLPVVGDGKILQGLVTGQRLALKADTLGSLNVWEITRYLSNLKVKDIMLKEDKVFTIEPDKTIEQAARVLSDNKIGCLPVVEGGKIVIGIISEVDLLRSFQEMLGLPSAGVRVTMRMPNQRGEFAKVTSVLAAQGLGVMGIGSFPTPRRPGFYDLVLKIPGSSLQEVETVLKQVDGQEIVDIRETL